MHNHKPVPRVVGIADDGHKFTKSSVGFTEISYYECKKCGLFGESIDGDSIIWDKWQDNCDKGTIWDMEVPPVVAALIIWIFGFVLYYAISERIMMELSGITR